MPDSSNSWPPELDAVIAAPKHHRLLLENESVRVLETIIQPGETVPLHTHRRPAATYFVQWAPCLRRNASGEVTMDSRLQPSVPAPGVAVWTPALEPHTLENLGEGVIHTITVEIK
jgi:quercetin dioxygenase-like cupin family protein